MYKNRYILFFSIAALALQFTPSNGFAQKKNNTQNQQVAARVTIKAKVVDEKGQPLPNVRLILGEGLTEAKTNSTGDFTLNANANSIVLVEAKGYKSQLINLQEGAFPANLALIKDLYLDGESDKLILPLGFTTSQRQSVGAISTVSGEELKSYTDISLSNTLQGRLMGLTVRQSTNGLGNNDAALYVRGLSRGGNDAPLVVVDGIERPIDFLNAEEKVSVC